MTAVLKPRAFRRVYRRYRCKSVLSEGLEGDLQQRCPRRIVRPDRGSQ
jgi:hypothetical protein